jgi:serine/threonine-protein kinase
LGERFGADGFVLPVAIKAFSPAIYANDEEYTVDMRSIAHVAARVAQIQHDHLLDIHNFVEHDGIRVMVMEWIDGHDLQRLLSSAFLEQVRRRVTNTRWQHLNNVIVTPGTSQSRLKPGIAIQVLRECLAGVAALHREGIVHGDLKPGNIMLKKTGNAKIVDIGSALELASPSRRRRWTPAYAAPEVLLGSDSTPQSDLASLGYVLIEMLAGRQLFADLSNRDELLAAKRRLHDTLPKILPPDVTCNRLLMNLCQRLIAPEPAGRIQTAEAALLDREGAAEFHRQLVKGGLASEYENDIRVWLEQIP